MNSDMILIGGPHRNKNNGLIQRWYFAKSARCLFFLFQSGFCFFDCFSVFGEISLYELIFELGVTINDALLNFFITVNDTFFNFLVTTGYCFGNFFVCLDNF